MTSLRSMVWLLAVFALLASDRASADHHTKSADPKVEFEKYTLDNGLEVILHSDSSVPLVAVNVWYHVGSGDETLGKSGFAHLFEHMLFQGSKNVGEDKHFDTLKNIGATGINGTTNGDRTNYFEVVPSHQFEAALWIESDRMGHFLPMLTQASLDNQIEVVRNERRQRYDNVPYGNTRFAIAAALYPEGHPYRYLTIGKHEDLASATLENVKAFYKQWYMPANATLALSGDFEIAEAKKLVDKWFGTFPKTVKPKQKPVAMPSIKSSRKSITDPQAKLRRIDYAWHTPAFFAPGDAEFDILSSALTSKTGRLYKILVLEKQLAQSVSAYQASKQFSSHFQISVTAKGSADLGEIEKIVNDELAKIRKAPITKREFDRVATQTEASFVWRLESVFARGDVLQRYNHYVGNPDFITGDLDRLRKTTPKKVRDYAAKYLTDDKRVVVLTVPPNNKTAKNTKGGAK